MFENSEMPNRLCLVATSQNTLSPVDSSWSLMQPIGSIDAYISAINRLPMLTLEEEQDYARKFRDEADLDAAGKLVMSHLRLVVSVSRQFIGYGLPHGDLIQEGNVGLMKAVKRFDPDQGSRLVSYAMQWIKSEIHEYVLKNCRIVKFATTKAQRKLFFNLRSIKQRYKNEDSASNMSTHSDALSPRQVDLMAKELNVSPEDVAEMEMRFSGGDVFLDPDESDDGSGSFGPISYLTDARHEPVAMIEARQRDVMSTDGIATALDSLDARSRRIVEERWLNVNDDTSGGRSLQDLADEYGVSAERIRQIEAKAMKKMREELVSYA